MERWVIVVLAWLLLITVVSMAAWEYGWPETRGWGACLWWHSEAGFCILENPWK